MKTLCTLLVGALAGLLCLSASAADWPQWRGPKRDGISQETGLLKEWPKSGPKLLWEVKDIGSGYSTPAVVGDRLYLLSNTGMDDEFVEALSIADGKKVWSTRLGKVGPNQGPQYPGARSTPTVDGPHLYALGSDGDLACLETASGKVVWQKNLRKEFAGRPGFWAYAESPLIDGDVLVCTPGGKEATIAALSKATGDVIWKAASPIADQASYASAIVLEFGGVKQYVQFLQKGLVGVDAKTGKYLWRYDRTAKGSSANIPTPVASAGYVFSGTGLAGAGLVKLVSNGGAFEADQVYFTKELPTSIGGAVQIGDYLYGTNTKGLICSEYTTGKIKWQDKSVGPAAICVAENRLYLHGESGEVALVEVTPEAYREKGRFTPAGPLARNKRIKSWAYPVVAGGRLYVRDQEQIWCYDVTAANAAR
jgi:outer membrane protein assembly factor BamB